MKYFYCLHARTIDLAPGRIVKLTLHPFNSIVNFPVIVSKHTNQHDQVRCTNDLVWLHFSIDYRSVYPIAININWPIPGNGVFRSFFYSMYCIVTVSLLYLYCTFTVPSLNLYCTFTVPLLYLYCTFTVPFLYIYCTLLYL